MDTTKMMIDLHGAEIVEIVIGDGKVWINVDGLCRFRSYETGRISLQDNRAHPLPRMLPADTTFGVATSGLKKPTFGKKHKKGKKK